MSRYPELGAAFDAIHENLAELDARQSRLLECRMAHLDEWADTVLRTAGGEKDNLLRLLDILHPDRETEPEDGVPPENREALRYYLRHFAPLERLSVLRSVIERNGTDFLPDSEDESAGGDDISEHAADKIAYVQNTFSDTAYLCFSAMLNRPRAAYFDSFSGVCEEVYNGICEYCILPILHDRDGKLFRFYQLLEKYDLRIVCACDLPRTEKDGITVTRYALIRKNLILPRPSDGEEVTYLELRLPADDSVSLCELLQVAQACRMTPERVDTRADGEDRDSLSHHITFRLDRSDIRVFFAFLTLDVPRCTLLGLYRVMQAT